MAMGYGLKLVALFTCLALLYISGMLLFTKGFLLKRIVIDDKNKCNETIPWAATRSPIPALKETTQLNQGCWIDTKIEKAVIIIIDALRYDFASFNESLSEKDALPFQNKLTVFHEVLKSTPQHGRLYRFLADPPTTTMQRIKGLTTGSLPTFVDAGSNFASYEIHEDNIISKSVEHDKKITFMGDDTWEGLFPGTFYKSFPFPSFNVKDLDTVDNGVIKHLVPELKRNDWDVLIGHFLGVDHCGHKYGPYHNVMADKLTQMDQVLRSVVDVLDDKTVLFVLGDHGMTRTGDHGGDSDDELDAALFVYSKTPLLDSQEASKTSSNAVSQVDFVPTFSLLLGLPIPFGSLGSIIPELFTQHSYQFHVPEAIPIERKHLFHSVMSRLKVLHLNSYQIDKYIHKYQQQSREIPKHKLSSLMKNFENISGRFHQVAEFAYYRKINSSVDLTIEGLESLEQNFLDYLSDVKELCHGMWAKFDVMSMVLGIILQILSLLVIALMISNPRLLRKTSSSILKSTSVLTLMGVVFCIAVTPGEIPSIIFHSIFFFTGSFVIAIIYNLRKDKSMIYATLKHSLSKLTCEDAITTVFCGCYFMSWLSNSFVVHEDISVSFLLSSLLGLQLLLHFAKSKSVQNIIKITHRSVAGGAKKNKKETQKFDFKSFVTSFNFRLFLTLLLFTFCGRLSSVFRTCREEQFPCEPSSFLQPLSSLQDSASNINQRFALSLVCACVIPLALHQWLRYQGNLNGSVPAVLCVKYGLPFAAVFVFLHWALQMIPKATNDIFSNLQFWQQIVLPEFVYWLCILTISLLLWQPLCVYTLLRDEESSLKESINSLLVQDNMDQRALHTVFREVKRKWGENNSTNVDPKDDKPPMVYGLGTVYSTPVLIVLSCVAMVIVIVLSDGMAGCVVLLLAQMFLFAEMQASMSGENNEQGPSWHAVVVWGLMSSQYFFSTGHQATIPAIRFEAAFVGLPGDMNNLVLPGFLIFLNTFASSVLFSVGLPVLLFWSRISNRIFNKRPRRTKDNTTANKGEFNFADDPDGFREKIFRLLVMYLGFNGLKVLFCACSAAIHRRHLMVWKIFAPRFVFECASFLVSVPFLIFVFLLLLRTDAALDKWTEKLQKFVASKSKYG